MHNMISLGVVHPYGDVLPAYPSMCLRRETALHRLVWTQGLRKIPSMYITQSSTRPQHSVSSASKPDAR